MCKLRQQNRGVNVAGEQGKATLSVGHVLGGMHTGFQYQFTHCTKKGVAHSSLSYTQDTNTTRLQCCKPLTRRCFGAFLYLLRIHIYRDARRCAAVKNMIPALPNGLVTAYHCPGVMWM